MPQVLLFSMLFLIFFQKKVCDSGESMCMQNACFRCEKRKKKDKGRLHRCWWWAELIRARRTVGITTIAGRVCSVCELCVRTCAVRLNATRHVHVRARVNRLPVWDQGLLPEKPWADARTWHSVGFAWERRVKKNLTDNPLVARVYIVYSSLVAATNDGWIGQEKRQWELYEWLSEISHSQLHRNATQYRKQWY